MSLSLIKYFEGFSATPYLCPGGHRTIGYGHVISSSEHFTTITREEAEQLLHADIARTEAAVLRNISIQLARYQFDALVSFTFNLGAGALQRSTLRRKVNRHEHEAVPQELLRWVWAGGRKQRGLLLRRQAEARLYRGGI